MIYPSATLPHLDAMLEQIPALISLDTRTHFCGYLH